MKLATRATLDDLSRVEGKAELIGGRIVELMSTGIRPSEIASNMYVNLRNYAKATNSGRTFNDNLGYAVPELPSGRESFNPDASFYSGSLPTNLMGFIDGPPTFAVEVRSEYDYGNAAEIMLATKREEYFLAGTAVLWDVDPVAETIAVYRSGIEQPVRLSRGQTADAEPATPGWRMPVDEVFA